MKSHFSLLRLKEVGIVLLAHGMEMGEHIQLA